MRAWHAAQSGQTPSLNGRRADPESSRPFIVSGYCVERQPFNLRRTSLRSLDSGSATACCTFIRRWYVVVDLYPQESLCP